MPSFEINPNAKKGSERDKKLQNRADAGGVEGRTAAKMLQKKGKGPSLPGRTQDMKKVSEEEVVPGIKLVDIILGEEKCGKGMYYCYTDKKCKKMPEGLKMTARFGGGGHEPQEVGIDKPVEGGDGNGGNGGGTTESVSIEDAFGNKFMEVVDLIKPEDITEKCWKGYKKKGMKTMFGKRYPNCVKANEENETVEEVEQVDEIIDPKGAARIDAAKKKNKVDVFAYDRSIGKKTLPDGRPLPPPPKNESVDEGNHPQAGDNERKMAKMGAERQNAVAKLMQSKEMQKRFDAAIDKKIKKEKEEQAKRMRGEEVEVDEKYQGMYQSPAPTHNRLKSSDEKARMSPGRRAMAKSDELEKSQPGSKRAKAQKKASMQMARNFKSARDTKEEVNVDEAVRLQAEYGNLLAVVVIWRGRSLMIKMFFPQATMPKREDVQREVQKVYPGCKVTQFRRTELPSETSPHNDPILRVQKEEAECAGTSKGKDCPVHGQKCCPNLSEEEVDEAAGEKDACYHKVKARYSVWPSAYASGALVKCRKKGAKNWGNKTKKEEFEYELNEGWVANTAAKAFVEEGLNEEGVAILIEEMGLESFVEFVYDLGESTMLSEARAGGVRVEPVTKGGKAVGSLKGGPKAAAIKRLRKEKQARRDAESGSSKPSGMKAALKSQSDRAKAVKSAKSQQPKKRGLLDKVAKTVLDGMDRHNKAMKKAKGDIETTKKVAKKAGKAAKSFGSGFVSGVKTAGKAAKAGYKMATEEEDRLGK